MHPETLKRRLAQQKGAKETVVEKVPVASEVLMSEKPKRKTTRKKSTSTSK